MAPKEKKIKTAHCQSLLTYRRSSYPFFPSHAPSERGWSCPGGPSASLRRRWGHRASPRQVSPRLLSKRRRKGGRRGNDNNKGGERGSCPWGGRGRAGTSPAAPRPRQWDAGKGGGVGGWGAPSGSSSVAGRPRGMRESLKAAGRAHLLHRAAPQSPARPRSGPPRPPAGTRLDRARPKGQRGAKKGGGEKGGKRIQKI